MAKHANKRKHRSAAAKKKTIAKPPMGKSGNDAWVTLPRIEEQ